MPLGLPREFIRVEFYLCSSARFLFTDAIVGVIVYIEHIFMR